MAMKLGIHPPFSGRFSICFPYVFKSRSYWPPSTPINASLWRPWKSPNLTRRLGQSWATLKRIDMGWNGDESKRTVNGRDPAPVGRWFILQKSHYVQCFIVTSSFQLVQDFFHPQYEIRGGTWWTSACQLFWPENQGTRLLTHTRQILQCFCGK